MLSGRAPTLVCRGFVLDDACCAAHIRRCLMGRASPERKARSPLSRQNYFNAAEMPVQKLASSLPSTQTDTPAKPSVLASCALA